MKNGPLLLACLLASLGLTAAIACGGDGDKVDEGGAQLLRDAMAKMSALSAVRFDSETTVATEGNTALVSQAGRLVAPDVVYAEISRPQTPSFEVASIAGIEYVRHTGSAWRCYNVVASPLSDFGYNPPDFDAYAALIDEATSVSAPRNREVDGRSLREVELRLSTEMTDATTAVFGGIESLAASESTKYTLVSSLDDQGRVQEMRAGVDVKLSGKRVQIDVLLRFSDANSADPLPITPPYPAC